MRNLANSITAIHHCLKWCTGARAFARFYIITADMLKFLYFTLENFSTVNFLILFHIYLIFSNFEPWIQKMMLNDQFRQFPGNFFPKFILITNFQNYKIWVILLKVFYIFKRHNPPTVSCHYKISVVGVPFHEMQHLKFRYSFDLRRVFRRDNVGMTIEIIDS